MNGFNGSSMGGTRVGGGFKTWLRRLSRWPQMDFELAAWQMTYLCIAPRRVYRNVYYHKQTKNTWARDDPAMLILISGCLFVAAILWSTLYAHYGIMMTLRTIFSMVVVEFFGVGLVISSALWALSNKFLTHASHTHATDQRVEWPYAFDVHANSFFPLFLQLYVAQLLLAPVVLRSNWVCLWVGNTLYLSAFTQYVYVTYLGYNVNKNSRTLGATTSYILAMDPIPAVPVAADTIEVVEVLPVAPELPYWSKGGIAPIKSEYVLWDKMKNGRPGAGSGAAEDDDAAEGRGTATADRKYSRPVRAPPATADVVVEASDTPAVSTGEGATTTEGIKNTHERSLSETEAGPEVKKVRLSGAQKKAAARARNEEIWQAKVAAKAAAKAEEKERKIAAGETEVTGGGRQKANGQNKGRTFNNLAGVDRICINTARGEECPKDKEGKCRNSHDLKTFLSTLPPDIPINTPVSVDDLTPVSLQRICPLYLSLGKCSVGFKCRFASTHMKKVGEGEGTLGTDYVLLVNEEKVAELEKNRGEGLSEIRERGEMNYITGAEIGRIRGSGIERENRFPLTTAYLTSIGEPIEWEGGPHPNGSGGRGGKGGRGGRGGARGGKNWGKNDRENVATEVVAEGIEASTSTLPESTPALYVASDDVDDQPSRSFIPDLAPIRASEKKRLDFRGKLYLAPLTTTGNLPFRRLCGDFGNDISCSEMGLAQEFLNGNASEWSLVRRHPSEKIFGIQVCGSRPQVLVPAAEAIVKSCDIDFLDVNCGCPIDLVFNKGGGSALLGHATKLGKSLVGMSQVLGEIPLTIKIRTGITASTPVAHKLVTKFQTEWGVSHVTLHGRSRQQRYKTKADYNYIAQVAQTLRETAADEGLAPIPIFGNGDAYDYRTYYENMEASGVDGIMIARGALMKPWIFTEIKERRDFDISSRERLDMVGTLAKYGLEHWGSDTMGINTTRRFMCEALSFQYRYVPVGLLERLPADMNERPFPYKGRNELETLLASDSSEDWVKLTSMFLGPPEDNWSFAPKHKSNAHDAVEVQG